MLEATEELGKNVNKDLIGQVDAEEEVLGRELDDESAGALPLQTCEIKQGFFLEL